MTPTTANRPRVCAQLIRAATKDLRQSTQNTNSGYAIRDNALASLDAIADELDPPRAASSEPETPRP